MRKYFIISLLFLSSGFTQTKEYNIDDLLEKDGLFREKLNDEILKGDVYQMFGDMKMDLGYIKNGKKEGLWTWWFENGEKKNEGTFKDGKENGLHKWWYKNGEDLQEWGKRWIMDQMV